MVAFSGHIFFVDFTLYVIIDSSFWFDIKHGMVHCICQGGTGYNLQIKLNFSL